MRCVADENVDAPIVEAMRSSGHEVWYVAEQDRGITDDDVLHRASGQSALLITSDKDFGELVLRQGKASSGVLLLRLAGLPAAKKAELVVRALEDHGSELRGAFSVLAARALRIRRQGATG